VFAYLFAIDVQDDDFIAGTTFSGFHDGSNSFLCIGENRTEPEQILVFILHVNPHCPQAILETHIDNI
jgi:hypothetical protein